MSSAEAMKKAFSMSYLVFKKTSDHTGLDLTLHYSYEKLGWDASTQEQ